MLAYTSRMDAELKTLLVALAEGQVKLAEGQGRHDELLVALADGQVKLEGTVAHLATATEGALTRLAERIDEFGERVSRGFTNGASTDRKLDDELHALDARVTKLERKKAGPPKRR